MNFLERFPLRKRGPSQLASQTGSPSSARRAALSAAIGAAVVLLIVIGLGLHRQAVGDGAEYYAMFFAWKEAARPFMTPAAWLGYHDFIASNTIPGLYPAETLKSLFPALNLGATQDFNHFWFYSFLAALLRLPFLPFHPGAFASYMIVHAAVAAIAIFTAQYCYGRKGLFAVLILLFVSPAFWYVNKVHTEWLTICLSVSGICLTMRRYYVQGAVCFAVCATQNPSFGAIAVLLCLFMVIENYRTGISLIQGILLVGATLITIIHPLYYFFRFGVMTPQILAGGASLDGIKLSTAYIWFVDPDLGLLPNWPLGILIIALAAWARFQRSGSWNVQSWITAAAFLLVSVTAQGATTNINSGASVFVSRYSVWYLCLFFPLLVEIFSPGSPFLRAEMFRAAIPALARLLFFGLAILAAVQFNPTQRETYVTASFASRLVQKFFHGLYRPPVEIFVERFGQIDGGGNLDTVIGPDCRTIAIRSAGPSASDRIRSGYCNLPLDQNWLGGRLALLREKATGNWQYADLGLVPDDAIMTAKVGDTYLFTPGSSAIRMLGQNWHSAEPWGIWSLSDDSTINMRLVPSTPSTLVIDLSAFRAGDTKSIVSISLQGKVLAKVQIDKDNPSASLRIPTNGISGHLQLQFHVDSGHSPAEYGANDGRYLGVGLGRIAIVEGDR